MQRIRSIRFFSNGYVEADEFIDVIKSKIEEDNMDVSILSEGRADLVICLGGDGTVIHTARLLNFDGNTIFLAVNFGSIGFLTNLNKEEAFDVIIDLLKNPECYDTYKVKVLDIDICYIDGKVKKEYAFNEMWLKGYDDSCIEFKQYSSEGFLQKVSATGIIIATPFGSTAVAMSAGGPIIINGNVMLSAINLPSDVATADRYFKNPIVDTNMKIKFITNEELEQEQIKKGNVVNGKTLYSHSRYKMSIKVDNTIVDQVYPENIDKILVNISDRLNFVKIGERTRTKKMRECILKIKEI